jgi:putative tricarboxylic transport membrane protein
MNLYDPWSGLFWLAVSLFVCIESIRTGYGTFHAPGPGFLPFWSSLVLGASGIIILVTRRPKGKSKGKIRDLWTGTEWRKVIAVLFALFLYLFLLPVIGYLVTTFGLMAFLQGIIGHSKMWTRGGTALVIVVASYVIFDLLLGVQLPKGIVGF